MNPGRLALRGPLFAFELARLARAPRPWLVRFLFVLMLVGSAILLWPWDAPAQQLFRASTGVFSLFFKAELVLALFVVPALVAPAIPGEREAHTLELLVSVPEPESRIVLGKLASCSVLVLAVIMSGFPVGLASTLLGGVPLGRAAASCGHIAVCAVFSTCLALRCSLWIPGASAATLAALAVQGGAIFVTWALGGFIALVCSGGPEAFMGLFIAFAVAGIVTAVVGKGETVPVGCVAGFVGIVLFIGVMYAVRAGTSVKYGGIQHFICPWLTYWDDALSGRRPGFLEVAVAWIVHLVAAGFLLAGAFRHRDANRLLFGSDAEWKERLLHPKRFTAAWGQFLQRQKAVEARRPKWSRLSTHPRADVVMHSRSNPFLPVGTSPIFWKETSWPRFPALNRLRTVVTVLAWVLVVFGMMELTDPRSPHYELAVLLALGGILLVAAGSSSLAQERAEGTLPVLLSTGYPSTRIVLEKAQAAVRWCAPVIIPALFLLVMLVISDGPLGLGIVAVYVMSLAAVLGLTLGISAATRQARIAFSVTALVIVALWWGPGMFVGRFPGLELLRGSNPFVVLGDMLLQAGGRAPFLAEDRFATFGLVSIAAAFFPAVAAAASLERQVRR